MYNKFDKLGVDKVKDIVLHSLSIKQVVLACGYKLNTGSTSSMFKKFCVNHNIDYNHFTSNASKITQRNDDNVFCQNSTAAQKTLKKFYINKKDIDVSHCQVCGVSNKWNGKPLILVLDHINGVNNDNRLENLRLVCPNCNSQLDTFCSKNITHKQQDGGEGA